MTDKPLIVAVTGANGHLGANVVRALISASHRVIAITREASDTRSIAGLDIELRHADVLDREAIATAITGASHVINLAAIISISGDPTGNVAETNTHGPANVAAACRDLGITRLVHVSSIHAFVSHAELPALNESAARPGPKAFAYDRSKHAGELEIRKAVDKGLDAIILNPTGIIGPYDYGTSFSGKMLQQLFAGRLPALINAGFDWVDVRDVAEACVAALTRGKCCDNHIISGHFATTPQLAKLCENISGTKAPKLALPVWMAILGLPFLGTWARLTRSPPLYTWESLMILKDANRNVSSNRSVRTLGYKARPLEETIRDCHSWYSAEK